MNIDEQNGAAPVEATDAPLTTPATELDGLSEFTFQGEKYSPDKLHQLLNEHREFSSQSAEYKKEKEFADNLQIDLDNVLERPELAQKFKATYPKKYHAILDKYLATNGQSSDQTRVNQSSLPKEFLSEFEQMKGRLNFHEQRAYNAEVAAANAKLDSIMPPLFDKFPMAIEDQVYTKAEAVLQSGQKLTEKTWERLVRESHESASKKADKFYGAKIKSQLDKGQRGSDVGPGGNAPGQAPVKPKTFAEAQEAMIASLQRQK